MERGFSSFAEARLVFKAQGLNVEWYMKVTAAVQNVIWHYRVIYEDKNSYHPDIRGLFFQKGR